MDEFIYVKDHHLNMARSVAVSVSKGPTLATVRAIEDVLRSQAIPLSRYKIRQALGNRVAPPLLEEALSYLADQEMVYDEGPGGLVVWIRTSATAHARLKGE